ncbi:MAG: hypothetical protein ACXV8Q_03315 [Methylobacter sp.]
MAKPQLDEILGELDAGIFVQKAQEALKLAALGTIQAKGKKGSVTIHLELDRIGETSSVTVKSTLKYTKPTSNGKLAEENTTSTPMYVDNLGYLTISPQTQEDLFNADKSNVAQFGAKN